MKTIPANCTVSHIDNLTVVAYPEVVHLSNRGNSIDFIGKTQRIETWCNDTLVKIQEAAFWYRGTGQLFDVELREVAA